uniref:Uncharacterized protein n=1 Tax=Noctiluca scintillans TaxID=2966 RepID=A0A7S1ACD8_NOCSC
MTNSKSNKRNAKKTPSNEDPMWKSDWSTVPEASSLEVFDMGECATWIQQLVQRKERAQRQGKDKLALKLDKEINSAKTEQRKREKEVAKDAATDSPTEVTDSEDDDDWDTLGASAPPYRLVPAEEYSGFMELSVRRGPPPTDQRRKGRIVKRLPVRLIGERGTPVYGLTEEACLWRKKTRMSVGEEGWQKLVKDPKITASTFCLIGGQFKDVAKGSATSLFARMTMMNLASLVPDAQAKMLAEEALSCGQALTGALADFCQHRHLDNVKQPDVKGGASTIQLFDIGDDQDAEDLETMMEIPKLETQKKGVRRVRD